MLEKRALFDLIVHCEFVATVLPAAGMLCPVQRDVGRADHPHAIVGVAREKGNARAGADVVDQPVIEEWLRHSQNDMARNRLRSGLSGFLHIDQNGKFIPAQAVYRLTLHRFLNKSVRRQPQQAVAGQMPVNVIDGLEAVKIDDDQADLRCRLARIQAIQPFLQRAAIFQAGERIVIGQPARKIPFIVGPAQLQVTAAGD